MKDQHRQNFRRTQNRFRDLPAPPRRSEDNYVSALLDVHSALQEARWVAPGDDEREWVDDLEERVRNEFMPRIGMEEGEGE